MTEILLNAILNLFAIQAAIQGEKDPGEARAFLDRYLRRQLRLSRPDAYLDLFEAAFALHRDSRRDRLLESAARIAANLRAKLPRFEQYVFLMRFAELSLGAQGENAASPAAEAAARSLGIDEAVLEKARLLASPEFAPDALPSDFLAASPGPLHEQPACRTLVAPAFQGVFKALYLAEPEACFIKARPDARLTVDSAPLDTDAFHLLRPGSVIRDARGNAIYQSEIMAAFQKTGEQASRLVFRGEHVQFRYPGSDSGLHDFSFCETGGRLIGIMGASGAGKSTLLGILNGQQKPDAGRVTVNGVDLHREPERLEGVIGYVPQDDLLFEDLTVFDNLYFSACLCLANLSPARRAARAEAVLAELNQPEIRDLKVGSPLDKTISGGQRKRLNIALELIREPPILFVDEPTSGLSSADSENVMGLLKAQAARGRLVIAVIHQPSSRIYRMFDSLWVLDQGGRPIFAGNPLDALVYFRGAAHKAGQEEYACPHCGNVNPEQLFEIIEEKAVDEYGRYTQERKTSARQWHKRYLALCEKDPPPPGRDQPAAGRAERRLWRPGPLGQLAVFFRRNLKSRLANRMYLGINLLEPPLLAFLAALLCRGAWGAKYSFGDNPNMGVYFFIAVIVALFMGLSVSAEEINRDRKVLARERFLNLSWPSYITAKALYLALVSALQTGVFTLTANAILDVPDMYLAAWLVLFCCSMASCMLGLNISAALKSAVTIYILIPLLLVPQIMLGGSVVPFDELLTRNADNRNTPLAADLMPSRWGFEALVVAQFTANRWHGPFYADDCQARQAAYIADRYIYELRGLADYPFLGDDSPDRAEKTARALRILAAELPRLAALTGARAPKYASRPSAEGYTRAQQAGVRKFLDRAEKIMRARRRAASRRIEAREAALRRRLGPEGLERMKRRCRNSGLAKLALNLQTLEDLRLGRNRVVQIALPACQEPESRWGRAHFLAACKRLGPWRIPTLAFNLGVLGLMSLLLYLALYFSALSRIMAVLEKFTARLGRS